MSSGSWRRALVLGGTRSGKSELAERIVAGEPAVRYVATGRVSATDAEWTRRIAAHRARRPAGWTTEEVGHDPWRLPSLLAEADPGDVILVDDIGTWVAAVLTAVDETDPAGGPPVARMSGEIGAAVEACPARLVLVSAEVGLAPVPLTPVGRAYVDALGATNMALAAACDTAVLVVAGLPVPLKGTL
ncbi:MAG: bifunctional adenosylcobinamide kinase/adenosylcobinamide-phosphate guanylyltransferase [Micromonosporaceae bacterium]|nr:bifunctional adenosylcobinamide kinase/adenosylcobinamide-phosphate guanylyltransferase [Micromonosporaceae bacterium]